MSKKFERMLKTIPGFYRAEVATMIGGLLKSWAISDDEIEVQLKNTKDQLFVKRASGRDLESLGNNVGVDKSPELGLEDSDFRNLIPVLSFLPKQVRQTLIALLDTFWGPGFTRPSINAQNVATYNFGPSSITGGTAIFSIGSKVVKGTGTNFLTTIAPGDYVKPLGVSGKLYKKVSQVIDNNTLELSTEWDGDAAVNVDVERGVTRILTYSTDGAEPLDIRFTPDFFEDLTQVTVQELVAAVNNSPEHNQNLTASEFLDPILGPKLNLRTNTAGLQGSIQILGGDANAATVLNFNTDLITEAKVRVVEVNPNEIVVQIPSSVPILRRTLRGSAHPRNAKASIASARAPFDFNSLGLTSTLDVEVEGTTYIVNFDHVNDFKNPSAVSVDEVARVINSQLTFLQALDGCNPIDPTKVILQTTEGSAEYQVLGGTANNILGFTTDAQTDPDLIEEEFPSSYIFDPVGQLFTVTGINANLSNQVVEGTVQPAIVLDNASSFPNSPGRILFNFGRSQQEGPISYTSRPNNSTLLIDASYIFQNTHDAGRKVNLISNQPSIPRLTGEDFAFYVTGTQQAREIAQQLIRRILAAGVVVRFIVEFPEFLFECRCEGCDVPDDPNFRGTLTGRGPLVF